MLPSGILTGILILKGTIKITFTEFGVWLIRPQQMEEHQGSSNQVSHGREIFPIGPVKYWVQVQKPTNSEGGEEINTPMSVSSYPPLPDSASQRPKEAGSLRARKPEWPIAGRSVSQGTKKVKKGQAGLRRKGRVTESITFLNGKQKQNEQNLILPLSSRWLCQLPISLYSL